jgi:uncharacterized protein (DUF427 family)
LAKETLMTTRPVLTPGLDHPITIERNPRRLRVHAGETLIADTAGALTLREASYPLVRYIPRSDVDMSQLRRSRHSSYCPYKGEASYFDIIPLGDVGANQIWTYENPHAAVADIARFVAFYPAHVRITELDRD